MKSLFRQIVLSSVMLILAEQAFAVNGTYALQGGVTQSDNIRRTEADQLSDTVGRIMGELNITDESSTNDFLLNANVENLSYKDNTYEDQTNMYVNLLSKWALIENTFTWDINGHYGQQVVDPFEVATPDNQQDTGFFSTGPDLIINFTDLDSLTFGYRYNYYYSELTPSDYRSDLFVLSLARSLSDTLTLSLNASYQDLNYESPLNNDFEDQRYSIRLAREAVSTQSILEAGNIRIDFQDGRELTNRLFRAGMLRQLNSNNSIAIDLSETVDNGAAEAQDATIPRFVINDVYVNKSARFGYNYTRADFNVSLGYIYSDQDYVEQDEFDQIVRSSLFGVGFGQPSDINYRLDIVRINTDYYVTVQENTETTVTLSLTKRLSRSFNFIATYENYLRQSNVQTQDVDENRFSVFLRYQNRI